MRPLKILEPFFLNLCGNQPKKVLFLAYSFCLCIQSWYGSMITLGKKITLLIFLKKFKLLCFAYAFNLFFFVRVIFVIAFYNESPLVHSGLITHLVLNLFLPAIPFLTICEHLHSVQELVPLKAAVWLSACRPRPRSHMKSIGWFASNDEYRSSALGSFLVSYLFQYLRSFCLRLDDLIGPQRIWRWTAWCAFISLQTFWIGKHVFDPAISKFRLPSGISTRSILLRFWVLEPIVWHFYFLCTQWRVLPSLAIRLTSGLLVCRLYCSKQLALMVCWPQGRRMGNATWSRCRRQCTELPYSRLVITVCHCF